jgi:hypothetical protein
MDVDLLSKMVKELILDNDRVVLPGLGCFVAEIVPAYFSDRGYTINPPYRKLYFRARPDTGESLIEFYAKSNNVAYDVAERIVVDFISELRSVLHAKKLVVFPGLGRLRATKENNIFFIADEDLDIYPAGFGLEPISLKTHKETAEEITAAVSDLKTVLEAEPAAEHDIELLVEPMPDPAPVSVPKPESVQEPKEESKPEPVQRPVPVPADEPAPAKERRLSRVLLMIVTALVLLIAAYMAVGRLCPQWIDQFLYTPEDLEIIRR